MIRELLLIYTLVNSPVYEQENVNNNELQRRIV